MPARGRNQTRTLAGAIALLAALLLLVAPDAGTAASARNTAKGRHHGKCRQKPRGHRHRRHSRACHRRDVRESSSRKGPAAAAHALTASNPGQEPTLAPVTLEPQAASNDVHTPAGQEAESAPEAGEAPLAPATGPFRFFSAQSVWNAVLPADAPIDPESGALAAGLREEVERELEALKGPTISTTSYSVPIYQVPADQPTVPVKLKSSYRVPALASAWGAVPLPESAQAAAGSDGHLVVWQPSSDELWEFWRLSRQEGSWQASWGGAIQHVSTSSGTYDREAWPGANGTWGASASGLSIAGGLITLEQLERGEIDHALAISVPEIRAGAFASPATRTDGRSLNALSLPEGAHLRLDPTLDLSRLHLPPLTLMLAEAAQRYGIVVRDIAGSVTFYGQDPSPTGKNPYFGSSGYFEGNFAGNVLAPFPWQDLQVLRMDLHAN
jgi:hypothetical protein